MTYRISTLIVFCFLIFVGCKEKPKAEATFPEVNDLPVLTVSNTDGSEVFLRGLTGKVILIFFNPDCDHCQHEAQAISENKRAFEGYQMYFISGDSIQNVAKFQNDYNLKEPNMHLGRADFMNVYNAMGPLNQVPAMFIYNDRKKIKEFLGQTPIEEIKKFL